MSSKRVMLLMVDNIMRSLCIDKIHTPKRKTTLPFVGLHPCPFCLRLGGHTLAPRILAPYMYMQRQKKQASRQAKKPMEGKAG